MNPSPTILLLVSDVFFSVKLENDLHRLGYTPLTVRRAADFPARLAADPRPTLVLLDLMIRGLDWEQALRAARAAGLLDGVPVVAFGPHTDLALRRRALDAGVNQVVANSKAMLDIGKLVGKYLDAPSDTHLVENDEDE
jgi:CheY-like chemotaxis protein